MQRNFTRSHLGLEGSAPLHLAPEPSSVARPHIDRWKCEEHLHLGRAALTRAVPTAGTWDAAELPTRVHHMSRWWYIEDCRLCFFYRSLPKWIYYTRFMYKCSCLEFAFPKPWTSFAMRRTPKKSSELKRPQTQAQKSPVPGISNHLCQGLFVLLKNL